MNDEKRQPSHRTGVNILTKIPEERRIDAKTLAARAAGAEIAEQKANERRESQLQELIAEIDKGRNALARLEARAHEGDASPTLAAQLEKTRTRLGQMEDALRTARAVEGRR